MPSVHYGAKTIPRYLPSKIFRPIGSLRNLYFSSIHIGDVELMFIKNMSNYVIGSLDPSEKAVKIRHRGVNEIMADLKCVKMSAVKTNVCQFCQCLLHLHNRNNSSIPIRLKLFITTPGYSWFRIETVTF